MRSAKVPAMKPAMRTILDRSRIQSGVLSRLSTAVAAVGFGLLLQGVVLDASAAESSAKTSRSAVRRAATTLDEVRIEGEIAMPQVLFVTSYEQLRFPSEAHRQETKTMAELLELVPWPGVPWVLQPERPLTRTVVTSATEPATGRTAEGATQETPATEGK